MPNFENTVLYGIGGALLGTGLYLYQKHYLDELLKFGTDGGDDDNEVPDPSNPNPNPAPGTSGTFTYWAKKKMQCRDNHLTFNYLVGYGVHILNWKLYNDGRIYIAQCGAPSSSTILVAIDAADGSSATKLGSLGFVQYFAPPSDPNPNVPIPNPPTSSNVAMTMNYVGQAPLHKAYKVFRHYRQPY